MAQIVANSLKEHRAKTGSKLTKPNSSNSSKHDRTISALVIVLFIAFMILSVIGVGTRMFVSLIGIAICIACFFRREVRIDWWIFIPLIVYIAMSFASGFFTYGSILSGYASLQLIFLTLYAASCSLRINETNLLRMLCVLWAGIAAAVGIIAFTFLAFATTPTRLDFVIGSPNGLGIFLVLSWFALQSCRMTEHEGKLFKTIDRLEPIILVALAMTLSMGSIAALVIGLIVLFFSRVRSAKSWKEGVHFIAGIVPKLFLSLLTGFLMYMAAERADAPILCLIILTYLICMIFLWKRFEIFLEQNFKVALALSIIGLLCIPLALFMRPSAIATFSERLAMMANGASYLFVEPILGLGPMQWHAHNLVDSDMYFNTNHIHNAYLHVGVEFGLIAMAALIIITIRLFVKHYKEAQHGEDAAFLTHMLTDTGFFFVGIVGTFILTAGGSTTPAKKIGAVGTKILFGVLCVLHIMILWIYLSSF